MPIVGSHHTPGSVNLVNPLSLKRLRPPSFSFVLLQQKLLMSEPFLSPLNRNKFPPGYKSPYAVWR